MELQGRRAVITGGASGIGRGLAEAFVAEGAAEVVIADLDAEHVAAVAAEIGATGVTVDVGSEPQLTALIAELQRSGPIDLFCSNAGINGPAGGPEIGDEDWDRIWRINVMSHVWAARALLPAMRERGEGYLLNTASAAGLLTNLGLLPYSVDQARRGRRRGVARDHLRGGRHPRLLPVPAARRHAARRGDQERAADRPRDGGGRRRCCRPRRSGRSWSRRSGARSS